MKPEIFVKLLTVVMLVVSIGTLHPVTAAEYLVTDQSEYNEAVEVAQPGDVIKLANGEWRDFEVLFTGTGTAENPIRLTAQTKGQVMLTGQSNLRLAGEYLIVSGLVFKDGYTPTQQVISFRRNKEHFANHSRVTEVVIDNFNNPERFETDFWVMVYGKHNRFDHNHLVGKRNKGVTMAVKLDSKNSQENYHRIDHNYFGPRPILGSNGGETLRIGTSHHSLADSFTTVENNYFDRCNGELEIISNKSGRNTFRNNTFFESRGTLTMRHGNNNLVEGNVFFGNSADHTGGIRVINAGQIIRNNYLEGLKGTRFGGALVVMNGVPNSPINRYHQVKDAVIENNSLIDSDNIQLAAGSDEERSAVPVSSRFARNLIINDDGRDVFTVYDDVSGIKFSKNIVGSVEPPTFAKGFRRKAVKLERADNGLLYPTSGRRTGVSRDLAVTQKEDTGVAWYAKPAAVKSFGFGEEVRVTPAEGELFNAIKAADAGDVLLLQPGDYLVRKFLILDKPVSLKADGGEVNLSFERSTMFEILDGGSLQIVGLNISGQDSPDYAGNSVIRTSRYSMLQNYDLEIIDSTFTDLDVNHSFNVVAVAKGTFADNIHIENSSFSTVSGSILKLNSEIDDRGIYNSEYLTIINSKFIDIAGKLVDYYRGGTDESTFGPHFNVSGSEMNNIGNGKRNKSNASLVLHGVQVVNMKNNVFANMKPFQINHTVGEPKTRIVENEFNETAAPIVVELNSGLEPTAVIENNVGIAP